MEARVEYHLTCQLSFKGNLVEPLAYCDTTCPAFTSLWNPRHVPVADLANLKCAAAQVISHLFSHLT